jgi:hypothetical protein
MSSSYKVARRAFLSSCGATALLLPLLRNMEARAQGAAAPLRFLVIHHPLGTTIDKWRPNASATTTTFTLPAISAPFAGLQSKMAMIDGLNIVATTGDKTHEGGMVALMTGVPTLGKIGQQDHASGGPSFDQLLLDKSPVLGGMASTTKTPFGSLALAADIRSDRDEVSPRVLSYRPNIQGQSDIGKARQPMFPETQPLNVFNRIFGGTTPTTPPANNAAALLAQKKSVLDSIRNDLKRLRTLAPSSEASKIDAHADAIQKLEASIQASLGTAGTGGMSSTGSVCVKPSTPPSFAETGVVQSSLAPAGGSKLSGVDYYLPNDANDHPHQTLGRLQLSLIKTAFACDLVRVSTFMWSAGTNHVVFPATFNGVSRGGGASSPHHPPSHDTATANQNWLMAIDTWYAQQSAAAIQEFADLTDLDGNKLLDNTVIVYLTEVARAYDHDFRNVPYLVFGGKNTRIQGGKFIKVTGGPLPNVNDGTGNRPTNDVWLALAPIFGVTLNSLGNNSQYTGPLAGLVG